MTIEITKDTKKEVLIELGKDCDRCGHCCSYGSGFVLDEEIEGLAKKLDIDKKEFEKEYLEEFEKFNTKLHRFKLLRDGKPFGKCIFLVDKKCKIQDIKPLHCRITSCKDHGKDANEWFIVNNFVNLCDPESLRQWNTRLKISKTIKGGDVDSLVKNIETKEKILKREI